MACVSGRFWRARSPPAHAQRIVAITGDGDEGLRALQACQGYVREVTQQWSTAYFFRCLRTSAASTPTAFTEDQRPLFYQRPFPLCQILGFTFFACSSDSFLLRSDSALASRAASSSNIDLTSMMDTV